MEFLHGVETIELQEGTRTVTEVRTAVIGLVGIAPTGYGLNVCTLVKNDTDAAAFGKQLPGFDIPQSLDHIFAQGAGTVVVVNVFDPAAHTTAVVNEVHAVTDGKVKTSFAPVGVVVVKKADDTVLVVNVGYTVDEYGTVKILSGAVAESANVKLSYAKLNTAAITSALIIGTVDGEGNRTGIKAWDLSSTLFGFKPKILIAPGRSAVKAIATELEGAAGRLRAIALVDSVYGATVAEAIASRGDATTAFGTSNKRVTPCYPYLKAYDVNKDTGVPGVDTNTDFPYSAFYAGVIAATDKAFGYWFSPSSKLFLGVTGVERPISANFQDTDTDANALNAAGIVTVFNSYGTGFKAFGNRNASFPTSTSVENFNSLLRTFDLVHESLEEAAMQFADRAGTQAFVDDVRESGNSFVRRLIGKGALTPGSTVKFLKSDNPPDQIAAGQYVFRIIKMGPTPAERITYLSINDVTLLTNLN